jgi:predicted NUDIX family phosphoesterase
MILGAGGGLMYVKHLQSENEILKLNNEKLEGAVAEQKKVIEQQLKDIAQIRDINKQLQEKNQKLTADLNLANEKFNKVNASGERRDVGALAVAKPKSIQRIEGKREKQRARCFEIAQGSPLTEEELNATKKSQINAECTNIANPNYVPY